MERKIRFVFDRKVGEMDSNERSIEAQLASFREAVESYDSSAEPAAPSRDGIARAARSAGALLLNLSLLLFAFAVPIALGAAARLGWNFVGP